MNDNVDHSQHQSGLSLTTMLALGGGAIIAGIVLAPYVAPAIGLGNLNVAEESLFGMHNLDTGLGLAGSINKAISHIPLVGEELAKGGVFNIITTATTGLGGLALGNWMSKKHAESGSQGIDWGKVIRWGSLATSALVALPSILTGVSNGLIYMLKEVTVIEMIDPNLTGVPIRDAILNSVGTVPYQEPINMGLTGAAVTLPHLLTCGFSLFPLAATVGTHKVINKRREKYTALDTKGNPLPESDLNHNITDSEKRLVETYNKATPVQKIIMKKELLEKGYSPDFHDDGTVHLHKHTHAPQVSAAR